MARHGLLMLLEVLLLGLVLFWCAPAQQKAAGHKQRVPEGLSLSSIFILSFHRLCLLFAPLLVRACPTEGGPQAAGSGRFVSFLQCWIRKFLAVLRNRIRNRILKDPKLLAVSGSVPEPNKTFRIRIRIRIRNWTRKNSIKRSLIFRLKQGGFK